MPATPITSAALKYERKPLTRAGLARVRATCAASAFNRQYTRALLHALAKHVGRAHVSLDDVLLGRVPDSALIGFRNPPTHAADVPLGGWYVNAEAFVRTYFSPLYPTGVGETGMQLRLFASVDEAAASAFLEDASNR